MADYTVAFSELDALLNSLPANSVSNPYSIHVTELTASNIGTSTTSDTLGYVLRQNNTKFVDLSETILPNSVTSMSNCFYDCTGLTTAPVIPNSVTSMYACFRGCTRLTAAPVIPNSVTDMYACFRGCTNITTAPVIPNSVTSMYACFRGCTRLTAAPVIPNSVTDMTSCFHGCTNITTAPVIPNSVTSMSNCFYDCTGLTTVPFIPNSVTDMTSCFYGCTSLTEVSILVPSSTLATSSCFYNTTQSISVKTQNKNALQAKLSYAFPNNVTIQDRYDWDIPFSNLNSFLQDCITYTTYDINVTDLTPADMSGLDGLGGVIYSNEYINVNLERTQLPHGTTLLVAAFDACRNLKKPPVIPNTVTNMMLCFADCTGMTDVPVIPDSVTNMRNCFNHCISITEAPDIPSSVTDMEACFSACTRLVSMPYIADGVTTLKDCFSGCTSLTNITNIPASVINLERCFEDCSSLTTINDFQVNVANCTMKNCFSGCTSLTSIAVPETAPNATKWQFVHAVEDSDGITMTIETDDTEPVEVETSEHTYRVLGLICDMLFSADAFDSTRMSNYLASRMPWIVESLTSLDANEDWTIFWAKDPTKVKSNCFALKGEGGDITREEVIELAVKYSGALGELRYFPDKASHYGFLYCDGSAFVPEIYPEFFEFWKTYFEKKCGYDRLGYPLLPDFRGKYIRGSKDGDVPFETEWEVLPNLTGEHGYMTSEYWTTPTGVYKGTYRYSSSGNASGSGAGYYFASFNAHNGNKVYGRESLTGRDSNETHVAVNNVNSYIFIKAI